MNFLPLIGSLANLATEIFKGSNDVSKKKHAVRAANLKILIGKELAKEPDQIIHSDLEGWCLELEAITSLAIAEVQAYDS